MEKDFKLCINILVVDRSFQPRKLLTEKLKLKTTPCSIHACFYEHGYLNKYLMLKESTHVKWTCSSIVRSYHLKITTHKCASSL